MDTKGRPERLLYHEWKHKGFAVAASAAAMAAALMLVLSLTTLALAAGTLGPRVQVSNTSTSQDAPDIAVDSDGRSHIVWQGPYPTEQDSSQVWYADDTAGTWSAPVRLTDTGAGSDQMQPKIALDPSGFSHVTWEGYDAVSDTDDIWYSDNTSGSWSAPMRVSHVTAGNYATSAQIAVDPNGRSHVTWEGYNGVVTDIWYSDNISGPWSLPAQLTSAAENRDQHEPRIVLDSNNRSHITWYGRDPILEISQVWYVTNATGTFPAPTQITNAARIQEYPRIALDSGNAAHITWQGYDSIPVIQVWYADNTTGTWTVAQLTSAPANSPQGQPDIAVDASGVSHLTWSGYDRSFSSEQQVWYSDNSGGSWPSPTRLTSAVAGFSQGGSSIMLDRAGSSHLLWTGAIDPYQNVRQIRYMDNTSGSWSPITDVTSVSNSDQGRAMMAVDSYDRVHITWRGATDSVGQWQVWYRGTVGPNIAGLSPAAGSNETSLPVTVNGSDFQSGATLTLTGPDTIGPVPTTGSGNALHATLGLKGKAVGDYRALVTNPDGIRGSRSGAFTVTAPPEPNSWYLAEGTNAWGFSTYITIENVERSAVQAKLTYMDPRPANSGNGVLNTRTVTLAPLSQTTVSSMQDIGEVDFSTRIEASGSIAVDRTMFWNGVGETMGYHSSIGADTPSKTWYLPEGSSAWGFETWTLVLNPNPADAVITLTYMTADGPVVKEKALPANCRGTYSMADDIGTADASVKVTGDQQIIAERSMYNQGRREGSCSIGATAPSTDFYLAEGAVGYDVGFSTYILVQNPNDARNQVELTFQTGAGEVKGPTFTMPANSRRTVKADDFLPANTDVSTVVHGSRPLVAERAMYWDNGTGPAFHASIGLASPHKVFMLPDGQTSNGFETWTLIENPNSEPVDVVIHYLPQGGGKTATFTDQIPAGSRRSYSMGDKVTSGRASILVASELNIIVERSMYVDHRGAGTDTIGAWVDSQ
jgi:hypothetical protein